MTVIRKLGGFASKHKPVLAAYLVLSLSFPVALVFLPRYAGPIWEKFNKKKPLGDDLKKVVGIVGIIIMMRLSLNALDIHFLPTLQDFVRGEMIESIYDSYSENYTDPEVGKLLTKLSTLPSIIRDMFYGVRHFLLPSSLTMLGAIVYFSTISKELALVTLTGFSLFAATTYAFSKESMKEAEQLASEKEKFYEKISDMFSNMLTVIVTDSECEEMKRFKKIQRNYNKFLRSSIQSSNNFSYIYGGIFAILAVFMTIIVLHLHKTKKISSGQLSSVFLIMALVAKTIMGSISELRDFIYNVGTLRHIDTYESRMSSGRRLDVRLNGDITVKNLECRKGDFTLKIPSVVISSGTTVMLAGEIGSGKSMFIKTLLKLQPYTGTISYGTVNGPINLHDYNGASVRRQIGYATQHPRMFNRSIFENITYGLPDVTLTQVQDLMRSNDITQIKSTDLCRSAGKNGDNLSGGQRQIVAMLRLFLEDNPVIILDEPTAALDSETKATVVRLIKNLAVNRTVIIICHDADVMRAIGGVEVRMENIKE